MVIFLNEKKNCRSERATPTLTSKKIRRLATSLVSVACPKLENKEASLKIKAGNRASPASEKELLCKNKSEGEISLFRKRSMSPAERVYKRRSS